MKDHRNEAEFNHYVASDTMPMVDMRPAPFREVKNDSKLGRYLLIALVVVAILYMVLR